MFGPKIPLALVIVLAMTFGAMFLGSEGQRQTAVEENRLLHVALDEELPALQARIDDLRAKMLASAVKLEDEKDRMVGPPVRWRIWTREAE